jgi:hypothetical protein
MRNTFLELKDSLLEMVKKYTETTDSTVHDETDAQANFYREWLHCGLSMECEITGVERMPRVLFQRSFAVRVVRRRYTWWKSGAKWASSQSGNATAISSSFMNDVVATPSSMPPSRPGRFCSPAGPTTSPVTASSASTVPPHLCSHPLRTRPQRQSRPPPRAVRLPGALR